MTVVTGKVPVHVVRSVTNSALPSGAHKWAAVSPCALWAEKRTSMRL